MKRPFALLAVTACAPMPSSTEVAPHHTASAPSAQAQPAPTQVLTASAATEPLSAYCYIVRRSTPAAGYSGCASSEAACRALLEPRRAIFREQGGTLESDCAPAAEPTCAVAMDSGQITFRSCAASPALCEEVRQRGVAMVRKGQAQGSEPTCRKATQADLDGSAAQLAPGAMGPLKR